MPDYVNVLPLLEEAASSLRHNELIQSEHISLFETTSAIEIGEPRMDTGVYTEQEKAFPNLDVFKPLMPSELLWVMDSMLSLKMKWFQGYALAQTIFTCKYVHELDKLDLKDVYMRRAQDNDYPVPLMTVVLRAFIRGTLKTCDMAMEEMYKRHVYDNEDFVGDKGGMTLLEDVDLDTILEELNDAVEFVMNSADDLVFTWRVQLLTRLRIVTELLCSVCLLMFDPPMYDQVVPHTDAVRQALIYLRKPQLPITPVVGAINPYLGKHLDSLAPPRPSLPLLDKCETFNVLEMLLDDIDSAVSLTGVENWVSIEDHFLSLSRRKDLLPYIRSVHQSVFYQDRTFCGSRDLSWIGRYFFNDHAGCTVTEIWAFIESFNDVESTQWNVIHRFMGLAGQTAWRMLDYVTYLGKNRPRQYRKLPLLLEPLARLEEQARQLEPAFFQLLDQHDIAHDQINLAAAFRALQAFVRTEVLLIGFDLELYAQEELPCIYWYLARVTRPQSQSESISANECTPDDILAVTSPTLLKLATVLYRRDMIKEVYHHLANATCGVLTLAGVIPASTPLGQATFKRRLAWAYHDDCAFQPNWQAFVEHFQQLAGDSRANLRETIRSHCSQAITVLDRLDEKVAMPLRRACQSYLSNLEEQGKLQDLLKSPLSPHSPFPTTP